MANHKNAAANLPGAGPGRPKGSKDKITRNLKARVLEVWDKLKKEDKDLYDVAKENPEWYYQNFVKPMLPKDIEVSGDGEGFKFTLVLDEKKKGE
jgi:hypothetical protein